MAVGVAAIIVIGQIDYSTGHEMRLYPFYFLPIAFVAWESTWTTALAMAALSAVTWALANWLAGWVYESPYAWGVNSVSQFVAFGTVGVLVAELRRRLVAEQALSRQDPLTSLLNSRAFFERAELLLALARRSHRPLTIAYLDLDNFKKVNDAHGHREGDRALMVTAEILKRHFRESDLLARLGGDEFAILMSDTGAEAARMSLERVCEVVAEEMRRQGWPITASVGAVTYPRPPEVLQEAVHAADALMYRAKEGGKNRVQIELADHRC
ncbi:MAG: GGDEF domain-containing protein [Deltaproteobacteria bacterium]|nr:GGDEF domain-containing protein [Deltaproteobacteria bacterium]